MRNFADLPEELLNLILSKVFGKDKHTFGLVCRSWNAVTSISPYRYSPCLMYYHMTNHVWNFFQYNSFFYKVLPELDNAEIRCSKHGWLLMSRYDNTLFFFDPFNNRKIELPCKLRKNCTTLCFFHKPTSTNWRILGISVPSPVNLCDKQVVEICLLKPGEDEWEVRKYPRRGHRQFWGACGAPVLHRGLVYFSDMVGNVATFNIECDNIKRDSQRRFIVKYRCLRKRRLNRNIKEGFLLKINGEEGLFAVFVMHEERKVNVFRLMEPEMKWESVKDIGNKVLYVSHVSSFGCVAYVKSMSNCIYFPSFRGDNAIFYSLSSGKYHSVAADDLNIGKYHSLAGDYSNDNTYGVHRLNFASWIMPTPEELT